MLENLASCYYKLTMLIELNNWAPKFLPDGANSVDEGDKSYFLQCTPKSSILLRGID